MDGSSYSFTYRTDIIKFIIKDDSADDIAQSGEEGITDVGSGGNINDKK